MVADKLANQGVQDRVSTDYSVALVLPSAVQLVLLQDSRQLPVLRQKKMLVFDDKG